jgi:hypothetical protein
VGKDISGTSDFGFDSALHEYRIHNASINQLLFVANPEKQTFTDYVIDVDVRCHSGGNTAGYGVIVRGSTSPSPSFQPYDAFVISPLGHWGLWESNGSSSLVNISPTYWAESSAIKTGDVVNHLTVICKGTQLTLMINGAFVGGPFKAGRSDGIVGVGVSSGTDTPPVPAEGFFSNLRVSSAS